MLQFANCHGTVLSLQNDATMCGHDKTWQMIVEMLSFKFSPNLSFRTVVFFFFFFFFFFFLLLLLLFFRDLELV